MSYPLSGRSVHAVLVFSAALAVAGNAVADEATVLPSISVIAERDGSGPSVINPQRTPVTLPTTAALLKRAPGANVNFNGPLTAIAQYRGMFAYRLNTQVDGVPVRPGGPNWMDAPLHYAPMPLTETVEVHRGIAPVSAGSETIGGAVQARRRTSRFTGGPDFELHGQIQASGQSVDGGFGLGGLVSAANERHRVHALGVVENGDDTEFPGGRIRPTEYDRNAWGAGYGFRSGRQSFGIDYLHNDTGDTGTPALPNDIRFFDTDIARVNYDGSLGGLQLEGRLFAMSVDHEMDNFSLRTPPQDPARFRRILASSDSSGFAFQASGSLAGGEVTVGADGDFGEHDADISNPNNPAFFVTNFNEVARDRAGVFAEWASAANETWGWGIGARYARVSADAGEVDGLPAQSMPGPAALRDRFNAADRSLDWNLVDVVAEADWRVTDQLRVTAGLARKQRAPAYQELYLWLPVQATAGLADGNNYVGNLDLDAETAQVVELGLDWRNGDSYLGPRIFYKRVDDYIQGTPSTDPVVIAVSSMNGDPNPLQFNNVDAEFYGVDLDFGLRLAPRLRVDGVVSWVRGKRRDIDDDLFRIAPLSSLVGLTWGDRRLSATAEGVFAAKQDQVSVTNEETGTPGYGLLNLYASWRIRPALLATAGINNAFDKEYRAHTSGISRVAGVDQAVGARLPGPGRSLFARLSYKW